MERSELTECNKLISLNKWQEAATTLKCMANTGENLEDVLEFVSSEYLQRGEGVSIFLVELFRYLRKSATLNESQNILANNRFILNEVKIILQKLIDNENENFLIKIILQFLVNLVVANQTSCLKVSEIMYEEILDCFYKRRNDYEVLALLYNLHLKNRVLCFRDEVYENILNFSRDNDCEYAQFLSELFLYSESFWRHYDKLEISSRIEALELLQMRWIKGKLQSLPEISLQILSKKFWSSENVIFQTLSSNTNSLEPYEISLLLDILGSLCGNDIYLTSLQKDYDLVIRCGVLLINIHRIGKQSDNYFSSVQKLSELKEPSEAIQKHPAFGFKVGLVRLVGNLCWKNKKMQDLVRETEIIPILLDCCNIDARNPLIMQWVILAIRNLCENNLENQKIIAGLHKEGTVSSALVEEMGLTIHDDEKGGIRIVPLNLRK
ncbi:ataxin-10 isoform X1 [Harmonia axyridis]|uniref:ataxin-10 isoform X1 n=1 Tax=Harmonia axyridis TaxID=115357 RepID=UPI001E2768B3|nr:ataxin-10 isoform X1 [Harmonia axyridis]